MATLEYIKYTPMAVAVAGDEVTFHPIPLGNPIEGLPQIFWKNVTPWTEANLWAYTRASSGEVDVRTVRSNFIALNSYANWLEQTSTDWRHFPIRQADRCLVRFRGQLIAQRNAGQLKSSTASARMAALVQFYRWAHAHGYLDSTSLWADRHFSIQATDNTGMARTLRVRSTDLSIPNRRPPGIRLEDGVQPVNVERRRAILQFASTHASRELYLMLLVGFSTGMRLGTIADLRLLTLQNAAPDEATPLLRRIAVGPGAHPPVHVKRGVTGHIPIPCSVLAELIEYSHSTRRLHRQTHSHAANRDLLFLTKYGNPYVRRGSNQSSAINTEIHRLRKRAADAGLDIFEEFHFHRTRATFATELARLALQVTHDAYSSIALVQSALLHTSEATSLMYIRFVQREETKAQVIDEFMAAFRNTQLSRE